MQKRSPNALSQLPRRVLAAIVGLTCAQSAHAFDPATDHTCVAYCGGGSAPGGGAAVAPAPRGPSPAELARRRQRAEALRLDKLAHAAYERGDKAEAARLFEQAARLAPDDSNIQGNRWDSKAELAQSRKDYRSALGYYRKALRYFPGNKAIQVSIDGMKLFIDGENEAAAENQHDWDRAMRLDRERNGSDSWNNREFYFRGRKALDQNNWDLAVSELRKHQEKLRRDIEHFKLSPDDAYKDNLLKDWRSRLAETEKYLNLALEQQKAEKAKNPNYPKPPPVYRDAKTPRDYPDLGYYTPTQHKAHDDNVMGNVWSKTGNWVNALLSYQRALDEDPDGPFSMVIKDNIAIAMSRLGPQKVQTAPAAIAPAVASPASQEKSKEIVQSNCTGWMTANGKMSRLCMDEQAHRYCEEQDGDSISRVSCQ
jgi:tetratricopeptide (TPR) repeat protein